MTDASTRLSTSWLRYDADLVAEIAHAMDLRAPNAAALDALVREVARGDGREVIADLATGVGKTYLGAALVEYLARVGVRNILFVTPGSTIQRKTIANFTPGSPKYVPGATVQPLVVTADTFERGAVGDALHDRRQVKLFIFNVQLLIAPGQKSVRRAHQDDEHIGTTLYEHLREADDLVIIADEHHVYRERAAAFNSALGDLSARAIVGLTATPDAADVAAGKVVYQYPLAHAIADGLVKIPVIAYRADGRKDQETQLADAVRLLGVKAPTWAQYAEIARARPVTPVLFVVCQKIDEARAVAERLAGADLLPGDGEVLLITSQSSDDALEALARVEEPDSPVRAIVSVDKLKEGWDVKNIGVILALRALASETLTEQILGRGLRLPFGRRTEVGAIDQVDIVAHESYAELLRNKDALLQRLVAAPVAAPTPVPTPLDLVPAEPGGESGFAVIQREDVSLDGIGAAELLLAQEQADIERHATADRESMAQPMPLNADRAPIAFPVENWSYQAPAFRLDRISLVSAEQAGSRFRSEPAVKLVRHAIDAQRDVLGEVQVRAQQVDSVDATRRIVTAEEVRRQLSGRIARSGLVAAELTELARSEELVEAFLRGAGVDDGVHHEWSEDLASRAETALADLIVTAFRAAQSSPSFTWKPAAIPQPKSRPANPLDRFAPFRRDAWFGPWERSIERFARFDSETGEFALAHKLDVWDEVERWQRIYTHEPARIHWDRGRPYFPDFVVVVGGEFWVVEAKSDRDAEDSASVAAKAEAARAWAERANESRSFGTWRYLLATELQIKVASSWPHLVQIAASA